MAELLRLDQTEVDPGQVARRHLPWIGVVACLIVLRMLGPTAPLRLVAGLGAQVVIVMALFRAPRLPGSMVIQLGVAFNLAVMTVNGGSMPVSARAIETAGAPGLVGIRHGLQDQATAFAWLGDVIPIEPLHRVVSIGDALLLIGLAWMVMSLGRQLWLQPVGTPARAQLLRQGGRP
jgi:Family of unknown function (DUF5317)